MHISTGAAKSETRQKVRQNPSRQSHTFWTRSTHKINDVNHDTLLGTQIWGASSMTLRTPYCIISYIYLQIGNSKSYASIQRALCEVHHNTSYSTANSYHFQEIALSLLHHITPSSPHGHPPPSDAHFFLILEIYSIANGMWDTHTYIVNIDTSYCPRLSRPVRHDGHWSHPH
jgi:hypothetical protein